VVESNPVDDDARRVWIDDRNAIFRRGLAGALTDSMFVVAGESETLSPAPVLDDVGILLFDLEHLQRVRLLPGASSVRLVALASAEYEELLLEGLEAGVAGILVRRTLTPAALSGYLEAVASGGTALPAALMKRLVTNLAGGGRQCLPDALGGREVDVLRLLAGGSSTREIAVELAYSERTVKNIVHDLLLKLDCRTRAQAVGLATRRGVI
jgi:DNA-binding NarL/FixJ family response regulator